MFEDRLVAASTDRVWTLLSDIPHWGQMLPTIQQVKRVGADAPIAVGSSFVVYQPGLPKAVYEVTDWQPGCAFTWVASSPGIRTTATHALSPQDGGTRLALGIEWSGPLAGLVRLLVASKTRRMVKQEADAFVQLAERENQR